MSKQLAIRSAVFFSGWACGTAMVFLVDSSKGAAFLQVISCSIIVVVGTIVGNGVSILLGDCSHDDRSESE